MSKRRKRAEDAGEVEFPGLELLQNSADSLAKREVSSERHRLKLQPQPPRHPFVGVFFEVGLFLVDSSENMKIGWNLPVSVECVYENGDLVANQGVVQFHPDNASPRIDVKGSVLLRLCMTQVSMNHENRNFYLRFTCPVEDPEHGIIYPVTSTIMTVIRHRLKFTVQPPQVWYKDEGGRDKCISMNAALVDERDRPVKNREVPLRVTLVYEGDGNEVKNQQILKLSNDSLCKIDKTGTVNLRVRIEEVSKNHQKQAFCMRILPDTSFNPLNFDIAADTSTAVTVLSKRNKKRPRKEGGGSSGGSGGGSSMLHSSSHSHTGVGSHTHHSSHSVSNMTDVKSISSVKKVISTTTTASTQSAAARRPMLPSAPLSTSLPVNVSLNNAYPSHIAPSSFTSVNANANTTSYASSSVASSSSLSMMSSMAPSPSPSPSGSDPYDSSLSQLSRHGPGTFGASAHGIISWCQFVIKGLSQLEWQHVGFELNEDGGLNLHKPLYRCPGCWAYKDIIRTGLHQQNCMIHKANHTYVSRVSGFLQDLVKMSNSLHSTSTSAPSAPLSSLSSLPATSSKLRNNGNLGESTPGGSLNVSLALPDLVDMKNPLDDLPDDKSKLNGLDPIGLSAPLTSVTTLDAQYSQVEAPGLANISDFQFIDPYGSEENQVYSILVRQTPYGFPAFSQEGKLLGFYQYDDTTTYLNFWALRLYEGKIDPEAKEIQASYDASKSGSSDVPAQILSKAECVTLDNLKEQALLLHFQTQANNFLT